MKKLMVDMIKSSGEMHVDLSVHTAGTGLWSRAAKEVRIKKIAWMTDSKETMIQLYFDERTWDVKTDGLIYTDKLFQEQMRAILVTMQKAGHVPKKLPWEELSYTEQGMQGREYVHMILGRW